VVFGVGGSVAGFVLAGGRSSRMGSDKALELFGGRPLIQRALSILAEVAAGPRIAGSRSTLAGYAEEIPDTFAEAGPLGGVHAGLSASVAEWNVFLPVDVPLMPASLLRCLVELAILTGSPVTVATLNGRMEPFPVVLNRSVLPQITDLLERQDAACHAAWRSIPEVLGAELDAVAVENLVQCGQCSHPLALPPMLWFQSANTQGELALLHRYAGFA